MKKLFTLLCICLCSIAIHAEIETGTCGDNLTWSYDSETKSLTITGSGAMADYSWNDAPWYHVRENILSVSLPEGLTSIGDLAFFYCPRLTSITIPEGVTSIGDYAFMECFGLISITIPEGVTSVGDGAFSACSGLTSVTIPESVTSIGGNTFRECWGLISVTIPESVTRIGDWAFNNVLNVQYHGSAAGSPWGARSVNGYVDGYLVYESEAKAQLLGCSNRATGNIIIPASVTSIGDRAFVGCSGLTSITIPDGVMSIGSSAFSGCYGLTSITIPDGVTSIGDDTFSYCYGLTSITIPNSVTSIGDDAFFFCFGITSITIPDGVTSIGNGAFSDCYGIMYVTIGRGVTTIGSLAFNTGSQIDTIVVRATTPPVCSSDAFGPDDAVWNVPVSIPCGSLSTYQEADVWLSFTNMVETFFPFVLSVQPAAEGTGSVQIVGEPTCMEATIAAIPQQGYMFTHWSDGNKENPRKTVITQDTTFTAVFEPLFGMCGDDLYWQYSNETIEITGTGAMCDYTDSTQPWLLLRDSIKTVRTGHSVTSIGENAFAKTIKLAKLYIGAGMENIAANAFAGCQRLYDIYCYPTYPPFAEETSFANYNVYLYIPCEVKRDYVFDVVWGKFTYIECMGSEEVTLPSDDVTVTPTTDDATFTWPTDDSAETYTLVITKDGVVFCTLVFNANGQLTTIAFKPSRQRKAASESSAAQQTSATATANGFRFTVTGLDEDTHYAYTLTVRDAANAVVTTYEGDFTTESNTPTGTLTTAQETPTVQKIFHNGQVLILRDGKAYNLLGQEVR